MKTFNQLRFVSFKFSTVMADYIFPTLCYSLNAVYICLSLLFIILIKEVPWEEKCYNSINYHQ